MSSLHYSDLIGFTGTLIVVLCYLLTQQRMLSASDWRYPLLNLLGSVLIAFSLCFSFNAASMAIELFWIAISVYGLAKCRAEYLKASARASEGAERVKP